MKYRYIGIALIIIANIALGAWNFMMIFETDKLDPGYISTKRAICVTGYALSEYERQHNGQRPATLSDLHKYMKRHKFKNEIIEIEKLSVTRLGFQYDPDARGDEPVLAYYQTFITRRLFWMDAQSRVFVSKLGYFAPKQIDTPGITLK